ncbi:MAG: cupin domain-containing protein [Thermoanaerobaculia bacterium]
MEVTRIVAASADARGSIRDVLVRETIDCVTIIDNVAGAVRGNHYHKDTTQWLYVLSGRIVVASQKTGSPVEEREITAGEMVRHDPLESHSTRALEDSSFLVLTRGPRSGDQYESDTFRLETPLQTPSKKA